MPKVKPSALPPPPNSKDRSNNTAINRKEKRYNNLKPSARAPWKVAALPLFALLTGGEPDTQISAVRINSASPASPHGVSVGGGFFNDVNWQAVLTADDGEELASTRGDGREVCCLAPLATPAGGAGSGSGARSAALHRRAAFRARPQVQAELSLSESSDLSEMSAFLFEITEKIMYISQRDHRKGNFYAKRTFHRPDHAAAG